MADQTTESVGAEYELGRTHIKLPDKTVKLEMPDELLVPNESQFMRGSWVSYSNRCALRSDEWGRLSHLAASSYDTKMKESDRYDLAHACGTQGCLVGWAALAFGETFIRAEGIERLETAAFLNKMIEIYGHEPADSTREGTNQFQFVWEVACGASSLFEREDSNAWTMVREIWIQAGDFFGYDTSSLLECEGIDCKDGICCG